MSKGCKEFFERLGETDMILKEFIDLKERALMEAMPDEQRRKFIEENVIPMAKKYGFDFNVDELDEFVQSETNPYGISEEGLEQLKEKPTFRDTFHALFGK